jgi:hypothetical protein
LEEIIKDEVGRNSVEKVFLAVIDAQNGVGYSTERPHRINMKNPEFSVLENSG